MKAPSVRAIRCAIYTRVSTEYGLDQDFNSLDAQYDAASAYIKSQAHAGWTLIRSRYDDGGYSGGSTDRPDLQRLLDDSPLHGRHPPSAIWCRRFSDAGRDSACMTSPAPVSYGSG
jgi:DNA invertase Pin-like site-specific DNA recombinase